MPSLQCNYRVGLPLSRSIRLRFQSIWAALLLPGSKFTIVHTQAPVYCALVATALKTPVRLACGVRAQKPKLKGSSAHAIWSLEERCNALSGLAEASIHRQNQVVTLPGYFRPTKLWDLLVVHENRLIAAIELKSHIGRSLGNNFNNRAEDAIGTGHDLWTAYRDDAFGKQQRPFVGWMILVEDAPGSRRPARSFSTLPDFPVFRGASYLNRYDIMCQRLVKEQLLTEASVIASKRESVDCRRVLGAVRHDRNGELRFLSGRACCCGGSKEQTVKNFDTRVYSISDFLKWRKNNILDISPEFQRRAGLKKFIAINESPYHGLNSCQGTRSEVVKDPRRKIHDVIRYFGSRKRIFNVHFARFRVASKFPRGVPGRWRCRICADDSNLQRGWLRRHVEARSRAAYRERRGRQAGVCILLWLYRALIQMVYAA